MRCEGPAVDLRSFSSLPFPSFRSQSTFTTEPSYSLSQSVSTSEVNEKNRHTIVKRSSESTLSHPFFSPSQSFEPPVPPPLAKLPKTFIASFVPSLTSLTSLLNGRKVSVDASCWIWKRMDSEVVMIAPEERRR